MTFHQFNESLSDDIPSPGSSVYLQSLWFDGKGDWEKAHELIQDLSDKKAAWIHAYLHRKEGDIWNADYWYRKAGKQRPSCSLEEEWKGLAEDLL
ncbi:MAG TPA: hypothetical protein VM935_02065 [Chitinophagaceae bacterium]|jgi:hypothetical protein|nr:hypothetical protein [Chitinophagaceae bacterium]